MNLLVPDFQSIFMNITLCGYLYSYINMYMCIYKYLFHFHVQRLIALQFSRINFLEIFSENFNNFLIWYNKTEVWSPSVQILS